MFKESISMSSSYQGRYVIDVDDQKYISIIEKYNQKALIESIEFDKKLDIFSDLPELVGDKRLGNLSKVIEYARTRGANIIIINYLSKSTSSLHNVLNEIDKPEIINSHEKIAKLLFNKEDNSNKTAQLLIAHIRELTDNHPGNLRAVFNESPFGDELTEKEALEALQIACKTLGIKNATHFYKDYFILFEFNEQCFVLRYGDKHSLESKPNLYLLRPFHLDIEEGFIDLGLSNEEEGPDNEESHIENLESLILEYLNFYFSQWKKSGFQIDFLPKQYSLKFTYLQLQFQLEEIAKKKDQFSKIKSVHIEPSFEEKAFCDHSVAITYKDGTQKKMILTDCEIQNNTYGFYLDDDYGRKHLGIMFTESLNLAEKSMKDIEATEDLTGQCCKKS